MRTASQTLRRYLTPIIGLITLACAGCDSGGVFDIVAGSLRLAGGIVDLST